MQFAQQAVLSMSIPIAEQIKTFSLNFKDFLKWEFKIPAVFFLPFNDERKQKKWKLTSETETVMAFVFTESTT